MKQTKSNRRNKIILKYFRRPGEGNQFLEVLGQFESDDFTAELFVYKLKQHSGQPPTREDDLLNRIKQALRDLRRGRLLSACKRQGDWYFRNSSDAAAATLAHLAEGI